MRTDKRQAAIIRERSIRLATLHNGTPDGQLIVVAPDSPRCAEAPVATLQQALENWAAVEPQLRAVAAFPHPLDLGTIAAPLPRAWQWLDGSVYASHGALMDKVLGTTNRQFRGR